MYIYILIDIVSAKNITEREREREREREKERERGLKKLFWKLF